MVVVTIALLAGCGKAPEQPAKPAETPSATGAADASSSVPVKPAMTEKEKAKAEPFANDLGPDSLTDAELAGYSAAIRDGYETLRDRCSQCHTAARPLNSEIVDADAWKRYVKRMMAKPGCSVNSEQAKKIWTFLVADSKARKTGANQAAWKKHRRDLLAEFKAKYPDRWKTLYANRPPE